MGGYGQARDNTEMDVGDKRATDQNTVNKIVNAIPNQDQGTSQSLAWQCRQSTSFSSRKKPSNPSSTVPVSP
jgi:hypothetical protein